MFRYTKNHLFHPKNGHHSPPTPSAPTVPAEPIICSTPMPSLFEMASWSSTPAWDPSSRTPDHQTRAPTPPVPALPDHPLLQTHLLDVNLKVQAKVVGGELNLIKAFVSGSMYQGRPQILYKSYKTTRPLEPNWITILHLNVKQTDALLVILEGEYVGRFALRICHTHRGSQAMALVGIIDRAASMRPNQTGIEVHLPAEHLGIVQETNEEKKWHRECMKARRQQARPH
jgi:hypothetical protein